MFVCIYTFSESQLQFLDLGRYMGREDELAVVAVLIMEMWKEALWKLNGFVLIFVSLCSRPEHHKASKCQQE